MIACRKLSQQDYIHVGMTAALTGRYSLPGRQAWLGAQTWVEDTNRVGGIWLHSRRARLLLRLTSYDDASEPEQCAALTERLITADQVDMLLGPYSSGLALRAAEVAQRLQRVLWNHGGASEAIYTRGFTWVVGILSPPGTYFHSVIDFVRHARPSANHVAIVHSTAGAFPKDVAAGAAQYCQQQQFETIHTYPYPVGTADFTPILQQLEDTAPAVILSVGRIEDDLRFAAQYLQCTISADVVGLIVTPLTLFRDTLGSAAAHFVGPSQWEPALVLEPEYGPSSEEVLTRLMACHPEGVDYPMAQAYAGGLVAQRCLEMAGTLDQYALRQAASTLDCTTFYGRYRIDPGTGRQVGHRMPVIRWQDGRRIVVWSAA